MQHQDQFFANNQRAVDTLSTLSFMLLGVGLLRLAFGEYRGFAAELCYSGASLFFSRTFAQGNQHKVLDLITTGVLMVSGLMIDNESFFPSLS